MLLIDEPEDRGAFQQEDPSDFTGNQPVNS
ncbi:hypothetical protein HAYMO_154 [Serratia phage vB_SmaM_Haymo]|uniref:PLxRFG domain-containing protein n=1 Tax=Serratia phage vB_SmaM_Yaphecito TaxID=2777368 RepID=A0A7T3TLY6_9CAUD|nr:PLxRFG domain-containing protein [Serratia phage vB_SmaM_Yaphecito]UGO54136.1 hypothetical protein HAYMO_154 [Serratia phage vB_SmaM_Haymo]